MSASDTVYVQETARKLYYGRKGSVGCAKRNYTDFSP